jgi:DNA polymerase-3 subunit epsilon
VVWWALDLETTGLDPEADHVLSIGLVPVRGGTIRYGERWHSLVRPPVPPGTLPSGGLRAHHILPGELERAPRLEDVLPGVDARVREGALLLHHAPFDLGFLERAYAAAGRAWPAPPVADTVALLVRAERLRHRFDPAAPPPETSLSRARAAIGLPPHRAHDALADAVATAELFLALAARLDIVRAGELY